jgi:hypothetical protein
LKLCIFCGGGSTTKEHLFARWLHEEIGPSTAQLWQPSADGTRSLKSWGARGRSGQVSLGRLVCGQCNSGWLSDIENRMSRVAGPLIADLPVPLTPILLTRLDQFEIAVWGVKTAMVYEGIVPAPRRFYTSSDREHLRTRLELPADTAIWIGRSERRNILSMEGGPHYRSEEKLAARHHEGFRTTIVIGRLVLQCATWRFDDRPYGAVYGPPGWDRSLIQVWPTGSTVHWPPPVSFPSEASIERLDGRFVPLPPFVVRMPINSPPPARVTPPAPGAAPRDRAVSPSVSAPAPSPPSAGPRRP